MRMGPIVSFFFKDRFDFVGWAVFPRKMSFAEIGFCAFCLYHFVKGLLWLK